VRGAGVGVVREDLDERNTIFEGREERKTSGTLQLRFNQIGGLDKLSKMIVIG
jgi:hypothetical protein